MTKKNLTWNDLNFSGVAGIDRIIITAIQHIITDHTGGKNC